MFEVDCLDTYDNPIEHFTQWDVDQKVKIVLDGVEDGYLAIAPEVHFANAKSTEALVVRSTVQGNDTIIADVPNVLLQEYYPLLIYVYLTDSKDVSSQKTIIKIEIPVRKRAVPSDYEYVENIERITAEQIKQEIKDELSEDIATEELLDNEIISIWNGATGDIVEASNTDIEAIFDAPNAARFDDK